MPGTVRFRHLGRPRAAWWLAGLALLYVTGINHGLPNRGVVWSDDCAPLMPLIMAKRVFLDGWNTGWYTPYPDFHKLVMLVFLTPYMVLQYALGHLDGLKMEGGYPYGLEDFDAIFTHIALITRGVTILMALGTAYFVMRIGKALFPGRPAEFGALLLGLSPSMVYYAHTETFDIPMLFWLSAAVWCYLRVLQTFELRYYIGLAALSAIATATKDYAYGVFVLLPLPLVWYLARSSGAALTPRALVRAAFDRRHLVAIGVFLLSLALAENLFWNPSGFMNHVRLASGRMEGPTTITTQVRLDVLSPDRLRQLGCTLPFVLGWAGLATALVGLAVVGVTRTRTFVWLVWPIGSYYLFTVLPSRPAAGIGSCIERTFLPIGLILAVFGGHALARLWSSEKMPQAGKTACVLIVLAMVAQAAAFDVLLLRDSRYGVERWFEEHAPADASVEIYGYRANAPRLYTQWSSLVVNQDESPTDSDLRITDEAFLFAGLDNRAPDYVVVPDSFARTWKLGKQATEPLAPACLRFFEQLDQERLGYERVARFDPVLGFLFGIPDQRRPVSGITIYQRRARAATASE